MSPLFILRNNFLYEEGIFNFITNYDNVRKNIQHKNNIKEGVLTS